jgi:alpha-beta hydrolase superfamily lysophospholipase
MIDLQAPQRSHEQTASAGSHEPADRCLTGQCATLRGQVRAADGVTLRYRAWLPADAPASAALLFLHGIASHGAWFAETATFLAERGIAVYAPDRRGSGVSDGPRGHLDRCEQSFSDLDRCLDRVAEQQPGRPIFLAGSSWAAKMAVAFAAYRQDRLAGLLLHGPGLFPRVDLSLGRKFAVLLLHRTRAVQQIAIPLVPESYTREPANLAYIRRDPLRLLTASASFYWQTRRLDQARDRLADRLRLPILLQIGEADPIMDPLATCRWLHRLHAPDRTAVMYRDASHTLDFESESTVRVYRADLLGWLRRQTAQTARSTGGR